DIQKLRCRHWPSPNDHRLGHSRHSRNPFRAGGRFRGFTGSLPLRPARLLAPLYGSDWNVQPSGTFTSRLSTDRSPSPLLDITTTATGLLCWRDSHPLEWQLASLHGHSLPMHSAPVPKNVRYAPNRDHSRHECELTLCARKRHLIIAENEVPEKHCRQFLSLAFWQKRAVLVQKPSETNSG